ncbi:hypothetical protein [Sphingomonas sanguinis]|jgi:hypothetical protein|nr:hypothetical protein [Sphingomonas sanguinis]
MRMLAALVFLLLTASAAPVPSREQRKLMDDIERTITLPKGAQPLSAYGRNYAFDGGGRVVARYLLPFDPPKADEGCEVLLENFESRPCTKREIAASARSRARLRAAETPAGQRRWYSNARSLPFIHDGGCMQVNVEYDVAIRRIVTVSCNGYA